MANTAMGIPTRATAIRKMCLSCSGTSNEVSLCTVEECYLWPYRYGRSPTQELANKHLDAVESLKDRNKESKV